MQMDFQLKGVDEALKLRISNTLSFMSNTRRFVCSLCKMTYYYKLVRGKYVKNANRMTRRWKTRKMKTAFNTNTKMLHYIMLVQQFVIKQTNKVSIPVLSSYYRVCARSINAFARATARVGKSIFPLRCLPWTSIINCLLGGIMTLFDLSVKTSFNLFDMIL